MRSRTNASAHCRCSAGSSVRRIKRERIHDDRSGGDARGQAASTIRPLCFQSQTAKVVSMSPFSACGMIGPDRDRPVVARDRFVMTLELAQNIAAGKQRFGVAGPQRERLVEGGERLFVAFELLERAAAIVVRLADSPAAAPARGRSSPGRRHTGASPATRCRGCCALRHSSAAAPAPARSWSSASSLRPSRCNAWPRLL